MDSETVRGNGEIAKMSQQSDWISRNPIKSMIKGTYSSTEDLSKPWLQKLIRAEDFDLKSGVLFFCVDCKNGLFPETEFKQKGADHAGHAYFPIFRINNSMSVHTAILMSLKDVDVSDIQEISNGGHLYTYLDNGYCWCLDEGTRAGTEHNCLHCAAPMFGPYVDTTVKYCCLECKYLSGCQRRASLLRIVNSRGHKRNHGSLGKVEGKSRNLPSQSRPADGLDVVEFAYFVDHGNYTLDTSADSRY